MTITKVDNLRVLESLIVDGTKPSYSRSDLTLESNVAMTLRLADARVWDDVRQLLPATAAADDLAIVTGTLGTDFPTVQTGDLKAAGATTRYLALLVPIPHEYVAGESITLRLHAGMDTTVSDGTATIDAEAYLSDGEGAAATDLVATAAQSINSLTLADLDFTITPTGVSGGDELLIRVAIAINDAATGTAVIGKITSAKLLLDMKG